MALKILILVLFLLIFWQDTKDRLVYWFLYPLVGGLAFFIQASYNGYFVILTNTAVNVLLIGLILGTAFVYSKIIMKRQFVNESIGIGDILLFIFLCCTFSPLPFIILLVFSLMFSLVVHVYLRNRSAHTTVPLAGYISLFFFAVYFTSFFIEPKYLFA